MQPFTCPQCGHESTFDPWAEAAHCPECGFTPPQGKERHGYIRWANRYTYQQFLDELLTHWNDSHTPEPTFTLKTPDDAERFFHEYQQALGEAPRDEPGRKATYVRGYHPNRQEVLIFAGALLHLRRGDYTSATEDLRVLTLTSPDFVESWIWLTATVDDPAERQKSLEKAAELDAAHPLARDALAMVQEQVPLDAQRRAQEVTTTQCPQCGGALTYEPDAPAVTCPYCDHGLALERTNLVDGAASSVQALRLQRRYQGYTWEEAHRIVHCQNCGAELTMAEHLAQHCTFCGSTNVLVEDSERTLQQPDGFLPFQINRQQARDAIRRGRRSGLGRIAALWSGDDLQVEELHGIYLPFWVFDAMIEIGQWSESFVSPSKASSQVQMIENLLLPGVDVAAQSLLAKDVLRFNLRSLVPYNPRLLADWPARLYALDVEMVVEDVYDDLLVRARSKVPQPVAATGSRTSAQVLGATYQLVLLPVWMAFVREQDGRRVAVVNGQTGKVGIGSVLPTTEQENDDQEESVSQKPIGVNYDQAADEYAAHRQVHVGVFRELYERGQLGPESVVLEVGCGTGNYISALAAYLGCTVYGIDPSDGMLSHARTRPERVTWKQGSAEQLDFLDDTFDLVFSVDVIHHVGDKSAFYHEAARALKPGGRVCTVTDSADIIRQREILSGYFPETVEKELARYPRITQLEVWMTEAGLGEFQVVTVEAPYEITSAQPFHDKAYSSLHLISEEAWRAGLARLERDLARGPVPGKSRYACVWGQRVGE